MTMRPPPAVAILAGGGSRRMGRDKALLMRDGETLLARTVRLAAGVSDRVLVVGRGPGPELAGATAVADGRPGDGPLQALDAALTAAAGQSVLLLPCDLPLLTTDALAWLIDGWQRSEAPLGVAATIDGQVEPLFAVYAPAARAVIEAALQRGQRSPSRLIAEGGFAMLEVPATHRAALRDCDDPQAWAELGG